MTPSPACVNTTPALPLVQKIQTLHPTRPIRSTPSLYPGTCRPFPDSPLQACFQCEAVGIAGTAWGHRHRPGCEQDQGKCSKFSPSFGSWLPCPVEGFGAFVAAPPSWV